MKNSLWNTKDWFVSLYNYSDDVRRKLQLPRKVEFHDVTLRDGEQQAGIILRKDDKLAIAKSLDQTGISRIEAGMPAISKEEEETVKAIAHEGLNTKVFSFSRCMKSDVDSALRCDVDGVVMEIPSSDHLIEYAYGWTVERAIELSIEATKYAGEHGLHVAFFTIDSTRAKFDTFWNIIDSVSRQGHMDSFVCVDTFGVCNPEAMSFLLAEVKKRTNKTIEIHCHNDFGLAVANSIAGVMAGAEVIHTTVNGIGERNGNAAFEEVAAALEMLYGVRTGLDFGQLRSLSKLVETHSSVKIPPQKPIVGDNTFTTESGIIAGWWNRASEIGKPLEVFPIRPEFLGFEDVGIVLGKGSGVASVVYRMKELGLEIPGVEEIEIILERVKTFSEAKKRLLTDDEFISVVRDK
ncbi:MAG: LeuA family protein [Promethearchaeota archaeon]